jgi:hypothetical protein
VGHTHEDIDALIGVIVESLRSKDIPTLDEFIVYVKEAIVKEEGSVKKVVVLIGVTDYAKLFDGFVQKDMSGISKVKTFRAACDREGKLGVYYKRDPIEEGWFPKPIEEIDGFHSAKHLFAESFPGLGKPIGFVGSPYPGVERGQRQHWIYKVRFGNGTIVDAPIKCISLPVRLMVLMFPCWIGLKMKLVLSNSGVALV